MTVEEDRLARWLKDGTPDPPIALLADDIVRRAARRHRVRTWVPVIAAACVVVAVALLLNAVDRRPDAHPGPPERAGTPTSATTGRPRTVALSVHPWHARIVSRADVRSDSLIAFRDRLFAFEGDAAERLVRLDPRTGRVLARTAFAVAPDPGAQPAPANGLVWAVRDFGPHVASAHRFAVVGLDPGTLRVEARTAYVEPDTLVRSAGGELLISSGRHLYLNPAFPAERREFTPSGPVSDLALTPDGSTVLELTGPQVDRTVSAQDVAGKGFTAATDLGSGAEGLRATAHGFFVTTSTGMAAESDFYPTGHGRSRPLTAGGGGVDPGIDLSGGLAWAGGADTLACADPSTGRIRARVDIGGNKAAVTGLSVVGDRLYASYRGLDGDGTAALIEMTPPKACGLR